MSDHTIVVALAIAIVVIIVGTFAYIAYDAIRNPH